MYDQNFYWRGEGRVGGRGEGGRHLKRDSEGKGGHYKNIYHKTISGGGRGKNCLYGGRGSKGCHHPCPLP